MVPPNETGSISEPVFFALRYNYLFRPYSTILSGRLHHGLVNIKLYLRIGKSIY